VPAFTALEELYKGKDRWRELVELYEERIRHTQAPAALRGLYERCAAVLLNKLSDSGKAEVCFEQLLRLQPDHRAALEGLEAIYAQRKDWERLAAVLEARATFTEDATQRADLFERLGTLYHESLRRQSRALVAWRHALSADARRPTVLRSLRAVYLELGSFDKVSELLDREAGLQEGQGGDGQALADRYLELGLRLVEEPLHEAVCRRTLEKARQLLAVPGPAVEALESLDRAIRDPEAHIKRLRVEAVEAPDKNRAVSLYRRIAETYYLMGGHEAQVEENLEKCSLLQPGNGRVVAFLERYYLEGRRAKALVDKLRGMAEKVKDRKQAIAVLERTAMLTAVHLQDRKGSLELYRKILELEPGHLSASASLVEAYQEEGRWAEVVELLKGQAERQAEPRARADILFQIARINADHLKDPEAARFQYEEILRLERDNLRAALALERLYEKAKDWKGLARVLAIQVRQASDPEEKLRMLDRLAEIHRERLEDPVEALRVVLQGLALKPDRKKALKEAMELGEQTGHFQELVAALRLVVAAGQLEEKRQIELLGVMAELQEKRLQAPGEAISAYQAILERDPKNMAALDALERLQAASGGSVELVAIYRRQLELVRSAQKKKELLFKLAAIFEGRMADFAQAIQTYRQILELDGKDLTAWRTLADLLEREGHWPQAAQALEQTLAGTSAPSERLPFLLRLATIYEQRLNDTERALGLCQQILSAEQIDPEMSAATVTILERLQSRGVDPLRIAEILQPFYALAGDWRRHIDMLELRIEGSTTAEERVKLLEGIATVYEQELGQKELAFSSLGRAFALAPHSLELAEALKRLASETGRLEDLAAYLESALSTVEQPELRVRLASQLGALYRDALRRPRNAIEAYRLALALAPGDPGLEQALSGLYRATQMWEELAASLQRRVDLETELPARRTLMLELGELYQGPLHDRPRAILTYQALDGLQGGDLEAWRRLEGLLEKEARWADQAEMLERMIPMVGADEAADLRLKLGRVRAERMEEHEHAVEYYRQVLGERPDDERAILGLESLLERPDSAPRAAESLLPIYEQRENWAGQVRILEVQAEAATEPAAKQELLRKAARVCDQQLGQPERAFDLLRLAYRVDPSRGEILQALERQAEKVGQFEGLAAGLEEGLAGLEDKAQLAFLLQKLADLYREKLRRLDLTTTALRRLLEVDPRHAAALASLETLYRDNRSFQELAWVLARQAENALDHDKRRDLLVQVAQIREEQLDDLEGAVEAYRQVAALDPADLHAAKQLDRLFQATGRWQEAAELLPRLASLTKNAVGMIEYQTRLAGILTERLQEPRRAIQIYHQIMELKPGHPETVASLEKLLADDRCRLAAAEELEGVYRASSEWRKLAAILEMRLSATPDAGTRIALYAQLREIFETRMGERALAFHVAVRAFREQPQDDGVYADLVRLATEGGFHEELAALYLDVADRQVGTELSRVVRKRLARVLEQNLGRRAEAVDIWRKLLAEDGTDEEVLAALERLHREQGEFAALVDIYLRQVEVSAEVSRKKDLLFQAAATLAEGLEDVGRAVEMYRQILALDDADRRALRLLDQLLLLSERWDELGEVLEREIALTPVEPGPGESDLRLDLLLRLAQLRAERLDQPEGALACLQAVLQRQATESRAVELLERMLVRADVRLIAAELLEPVYRRLADFRKLVAIMEVLLAGRPDPAARMAIFRELMRIYEAELSQKPLAFMVACRAFREHVQDEGIRLDLERLAQETGAFEELAGVLEEVLPSAAGHPVQAVLERRLAQLKEAYLQDKDEAVSHWRQVLASDPDDAEALKALERLYRERGAYQELVGVLRHMAALASTQERKKDLYHEVATLMEERLGRNDGAIDAYREILLEDPRDLAVLKLLDRLLEREGRWEELREVLQQQLDRAATSELVPLQLRLGQLHRQHLKDPAQAVDVFGRILKAEPIQPQAIQALVEMFEADQARAKAAPLLAQVLEATGDWQHLIAALEVMQAQAESGSQRKAALLRIAHIYETRLGQKEMAFNVLGRAFQEDPADDRVRTALERLAEETGEFDMLAAILQRRLEGLEERGLVLWIQRRLASLYEERLEDVERARECLLAVVSLEPKSEAALFSLERIHRAREDHEALVDVLRRRLKITPSPEAATALLYEIASIHEERLADLGGAIQAYREVLQLQPKDLTAHRMLDRLCSAQGRTREVAEVLVAEIRLLDELGEYGDSLDLRFRLAQLFEAEFADHERASTLYRDILQANPSHEKTIAYLEGSLAEGRAFEGAQDLLEVAYASTGDWKKYLDILEGQVRQSRVMARRLELLEKIAMLQEHKLGMSIMAFNTYVRMFHEDLSSVRVRAELERLALQDENLEALAAVFEEELDNIEEPQVGAEIALKVADIQLQQMDSPEDAAKFYRRALRFDPRNLHALAALERLHLQREEWDEAVEIMAREVDLLSAPDDLVRVLYALGSILRERLAQISKAVGYFRRALDLKPGHMESLRALAEAFAELGDHESLAEVLREMHGLVKDPTEKLQLVTRLANLAADELARPDEAIDLWQTMLAEQPRNQDAFDALNRLFERTGRWRELAELLEARMRATTDPEKISLLSSRLGWVKGEKLGELEEAMRSWLEVLRLNPKDVTALQALRGIYASQSEWDKLLQVLRKLVPLQEDMAGVKSLRFELAEILGERLQRKEEAIEAAKRALDIEPHTAVELERMSRIFQTNQAWQDAVSVLEMAAGLCDNDADRIATLLDVALLWREQIRRPLGAAPAYEKILEVEPTHEEAYRACLEIYREHKEWRRLTAIMEARLAQIRERKDRVVLMKDIAEIYERHLGQKELAFARFCAAFREDFSDDFVLGRLEELAAETEDYETLLEVLEDATAEVTTGARAVGLLQKVAQVYWRRMGEAAEAESRLLRAVSLDRRDVSSLDFLAELYEEQQRWDDMVHTLETKYERTDDLDGRKALRARISTLQEERLGRVDLAIESQRRILELDGRDTEAIRTLIRLYQQEARWQELIGILRRAANQAEDRQISIQHLFNIATILETEIDSDEDAIEAYRDVLEFEASHLPSLQALERIYTRLDRQSELLQVFDRQVGLVASLEDKIKIYAKMGNIWEERFSNFPQAATCFESILDLEARHLPSIKALERLVRRMGDHSRLIELYYRHIDLIQDRAEIVAIHLAIGEVWYRELSRVDKAEEVFTRALQIDDQSKEAIHALGQLYEKSGNWFNAIEMLQREAELCGATPEAVDLYYRLGKIHEDMLLDSRASRDAYTKALTIDPSFLPAIKALKLIHYLDKEYDAYLHMMAQEAEHTEDVEEKTRLYHEIGKFLQEQREDSTQAARYYEEALRLTADFMPAAKPLADIYFRSEQWENAERMMEIVVQGLDRNAESKELCRQHYRLGYITEKLGKEDKALEHYRLSYELDATYLPALEGLGNALIKTERWEEAYRIYQTILIHHRDSLSDAEVAELYWQLGDVNFHMGETERALQNFAKALEIEPAHVASLQYCVRIHEQQGGWEEAYEFSQQLVECLEGEELYEHYLHMAEICRTHLQDAFRAVDALLGAMRIRSDDLEVLAGLRDLYLQTRQHQKAVEILERIMEIEARPSRLVEAHLQAAELLRDELRDDGRAVEHFNRALDTDPSQVKAFQAISEILSRRKDWLQLKEAYIKMIKRLPPEARKTKLALWKDLGELCRVVLRNLNESIDAYRMIVALDPDDVDALAVLGDLLGAKPAALEEAIATHHKVLARAADRVNSYRSLWKLYNGKKEYDKVFALTTILKYLKKADEEEQKIVNFFTRKAPQQGSRPVTDPIWEKLLAHPDVRVPFTRIFGTLYRMAAPMFVVEHKDINLRRKEHQVDLARDRSLVAHNFRIAAKVLGGLDVELFALKEQSAPNPPGLAIALTKPTAVIAFKDIFAEDKMKFLQFHIGRQLAMSRAEFVLACAMPFLELNNLLQAACLLVRPAHKAEGDARGIERARANLKKALTEQGMGMLQRALAEYLKEPRTYSLKRWVEAVEHSINRAGLVVCNDLAVSLAVLKQEGGGLTPMRPIQRVRELLVFASSLEYFALREALGLAVGTG
jgi:tetratricopeptide (TPR) repeat protein